MRIEKGMRVYDMQTGKSGVVVGILRDEYQNDNHDLLRIKYDGDMYAHGKAFTQEVAIDKTATSVNLEKIRQAMAERINKKYKNIFSTECSGFFEQNHKAEINTLIGDVFAWVAMVDMKLSPDQYEYARKQLFVD